MPGGGGVRAILIRFEPRKPLLIRRRIGYFCNDQTIEEAKLYSTNADGVPIPVQARCCGSAGDVLSQGGI
jgi:hypothetical protein